MVVFTTIGWNRDGLDMARVQDIGTGTAAVRISMTAVPGLRSQQTFYFPGIIAIDPPTLSFWDDEASLVAWAYRQATHKRQMDRYRTTGNADRASFTRLTALRSSGTWHGADPAATPRRAGGWAGLVGRRSLLALAIRGPAPTKGWLNSAPWSPRPPMTPRPRPPASDQPPIGGPSRVR